MTSALDSYLENIELEFKTIRTVIKSVQSAADNKKQQEADNAKDAVSNIENILDRKYQRALDRVTDSSQKSEYANKRREIEETFSVLKQNLESAKRDKTASSSSTEPLVPKAKKAGSEKTDNKKDQQNNSAVSVEEEEKQRKRQEREKRRQAEEEQRQRRLEETSQPKEVKEILDIQKDTLNSLAKSKGINEETLRIADGIAQKLAQQTEQMEAIQNKLNELGSGLTRAGKEVNTVMRGIATDKLMMLCICCIIMIALGLVVGRIVWYYADSISGKFNINVAGSAGTGTK